MVVFVDSVLDRITMYRLVLYVLLGLVAVASAESATGLLPYTPVSILFSTVLAVAVCWVVNESVSSMLGAAKSVESVYITGLIIALILPPATFGTLDSALVIIVASAVAMLSKYILAIHGKHLFNPAAFGVAFTGFFMGGYASWWVGGNLALLPFVLVGGLLIVRKIRRFQMVGAFSIVALCTIAFTTPATNIFTPLVEALIHTPLLFFAFIMLTEPATMPPSRSLRIAYAVLVGFLFAPAIHLWNVYSSPELALLAGNIFSYAVSPKGRYKLRFVRSDDTSASTREYIFSTDRKFPFKAGQYVEWTLPHAHPDNRGTRRYFTIASSPTDPEVRLGVRVYEQPSSFKKALAMLTPGSPIFVSQVAGDFVLPKDTKKKLAFIAGGIGITPFMSMFRLMSATNEKRDIVLLYSTRTASDAAYKDELEYVQQRLGTKVVKLFQGQHTSIGGTRMLTAHVLATEISDYRERIFYISGPQAMVQDVRHELIALGVHRRNIRTDYFTGLA
jgi:ferredoxin-NADP reductase/Na+-translocating ferredoxin:NAD+ oxidoreductase RnfD subunit